MSAEQIFSLVNVIAMAAWLLLAVLPHQRWVAETVSSVVVPALLATVYTAIVVMEWGESSGGFSSLAEVALLFQNPWMLLAGWTHYLAFDLLVGSWEVRDAGPRGLPHLLMLPCLSLTFLFGPAGWLFYMALRTGHARYASNVVSKSS